jgi:pimeloyl-ACP methyl ester carboxylesterase
MAAMPPAYAELDHGITLCYETFGDPSDPTLLLIMGLGGHMVEWRDELVQQLVDHGFHVVRFDNRDAGLSTFLPDPVDVFEVFGAVTNGGEPQVPYLLSDMAADAIGLLDHLGIDQAHVVGVSLGGMIAQTIAIEHPSRVASLISIMSTTGDPDVGMPAPEAISALLDPPPRNREEAADRRVQHARIWGSPGLWDEAELRAQSGELWDRHHDPYGSGRQLSAILASGSRGEGLRHLAIPTLAIHGTADKLVDPSGSQRLAELVPGARLVMIEGMGHDLVRPMWPRLVELVTGHARQHAGAAGTGAGAAGATAGGA